MLFGLTRATHLNGLAVRVLDELSDDGRQPVEVVLSDGRLVRVRARPANIGRQASQEQVVSVLSSLDLATQVVLSHRDELLTSMGTVVEGEWVAPSRAVYSPPDLSVIAWLAGINRTFARAVESDELWRALCGVRWMSKWGFQARMTQRHSGWRAAYIAEERDATREAITPAELHALQFDFRSWLTPTGTDAIFETGLHRSLSRRVRLVPGDVEGEHPPHGPFAAQGRVLGHPFGEDPPMAWFLDEDGRGIQWGYLPNLWAKGVVRRTPSWGWEVCNPNVCLRALDHDHEEDESDRGNAVTDEDGSNLWNDLLDSLVVSRFRLRQGDVAGVSKGVARVPSGGRGIPGMQLVNAYA